jgi:hypothetical protein
MKVIRWTTASPRDILAWGAAATLCTDDLRKACLARDRQICRGDFTKCRRVEISITAIKEQP